MPFGRLEIFSMHGSTSPSESEGLYMSIIEKLLSEGGHVVTLGKIKLPPDCAIVQSADGWYYGVVSRRGSMPLATLRQAHQFIKYQLRLASGVIPQCGELWDAPNGQSVIILGNTIRKDGTVWVADRETGKSEWLAIRKLRKVEQSLPFREVVHLCEQWAREGDADAMWWLAWWYEMRRNGMKSVAYYVAALRRDTRRFGDAEWFTILCQDAVKRVVAYDNPKRIICDLSAAAQGNDEESVMLRKALEDAESFVDRFSEFRHAQWVPDRTLGPRMECRCKCCPGDWREAVAIAELAPQREEPQLDSNQSVEVR